MGDVNRMEHVWSPCAGVSVRRLHLHRRDRGRMPALCMTGGWPLACLWGVPVAFGLLFGSRKLAGRSAERTTKAPPSACRTGCRRRWRTSGRSAPPIRRSVTLPGCTGRSTSMSGSRSAASWSTGLFVNAASVIMRLGVATTILVGAELILSGQHRLHAAVPVPAGHHPDLCALRPELGADRGAVRFPGVRRPHEWRFTTRPSPKGRRRFQPKGHDIVFEHVEFAYDEKEVSCTM